MASNPPPSGPGQPWPGVPTDTPAAGQPTGSAQPAPSQWAQPAPSQWGQGAVPPQGQWPPRPPTGAQPQAQWPPPPPAAQPPQQGQWSQPPQPAQPPQQGQWNQPPQQGQWARQPQPQGQWGQQPQGQQGQQGQWGQQPQGQQGQWGQQPQGQWGQQPQGQQGQWGQPTQWPPQQPPGNPWAPAVAAAAWGEQELEFGASDYPVDVRFTPEANIGRYWGILWFGMWLRGLLLIPHLIVLYFVGIVAFLATLVTWIPVLLTGRYPSWGYTLVGGYLRWATRVGAWYILMSGSYPSFTGAEREGQHVRVLFDQERPVGRFWGIPIVGIAIRAIILIPHFLVLWLLSFLAAILIVFAWVPVLFKGRQADLVYQVVGGWMRWYTRVAAYLLLMSGPYPPFRLD